MTPKKDKAFAKNKPIHILHFISKFTSGGVQSFLLNYEKSIDNDTIIFDYVVQASEIGCNEAEAQNYGSAIFHVSPIKGMGFQYMKEVYHLLKTHPEYQIVHAHLNFRNYVPLLAAKMAGVKIRISHSHSNNPAMSFAKKLCRSLFRLFLPAFSTDYWACGVMSGEWLYGRNRMKKGKVRVIRNAVSAEDFSFSPKVRLKIRRKLKIENEHLFIHIGMFGEAKNHHFLIELFARYLGKDPEAVLVLCGDGPRRIEIEQQIRSLHVEENVIILGVIKNINEYLMAADLLLLPSLFEGFPVTCVEAQTAGCSCVVSNAVPDEATFSENVFHCDTYSSDEWLGKIEKALNLTFDRSEGAQLCIKNGFDLNTESIKLQVLYWQKANQIR